jgi:hypothetical protein
MRWQLFAVGLFAAGGAAPLQDDTKAIVQKAIKAHGGAEKLAKITALQLKNKGTIEVAGGLAFEQEILIQHPDHLKEVMHLQVQGQKVTVTTVYDGKKGWLSVNGQTNEMEAKILDEVKEALHQMRMARLIFLGDKTVELAALGEVKVNGRPAVGLKATSKGHKDVDMFFDKETGLLAKVVRQAYDPMTDQQVMEERIVTEYQEVDGQKVAKKVLINRDGKKFLEAESVEIKYPATINPGEFAKP